MKNIKKIIIILSLILSFLGTAIVISSPVNAQSININNMTTEQKAQLIKILKTKILEITQRINFLLEERYSNALLYKLDERPQRENIRFPIPVNTDYDYISGDPQAKLFIVNYTELECPFCKKERKEVLGKLKAKYPSSDLSFVFRDFPISEPYAQDLHPSSDEEAIAAQCAGALGGSKKYYQLINDIFAVTKSDGKFPLDTLPQMAQNIGIDKYNFNKCLKDPEMEKLIRASFDEGVYAGVQGTPTVFIMTSDGSGVKVPSNIKVMERVIDDILANWDN